jgi:pimeloyl-ACP methyl ester carboxylesterase
MMDARAHGASEGQIATYGWLERNDTKSIIDALLAQERRVRTDLQMEQGYGPSASMGNFPVRYPHPPAPPTPHIFALGESMGAGIALQSAAADPRIEGVVAESAFANLREATYDYAGLRRSPLLGKTIFAPFSWTLLYRGEKLTGLPVAEISPEKAVATRAFSVLLICDEKDEALPCRHTQRIFAAARGPKQLWEVPGTFHTAALGFHLPNSNAASWIFSLTLRSPSPSNRWHRQSCLRRFLQLWFCGTGILACQLFTIQVS